MVAVPVPARGVRAFISYAHDSPDHVEAVRTLWLLLRRCGVDAKLDVVAAQQPRDWTLWMLEQLREAAFVLVIASPEYRLRVEGRETPSRGRGAQFEGSLIRNEFYRDQVAGRAKFLPVSLARRPHDLYPAAASTGLSADVPATKIEEWAGCNFHVLLKVYAKRIAGRTRPRHSTDTMLTLDD